MRDWAISTALAATKATGGTRFVLALVAGHWSPRARVSRPGTRRVAELAGSSQSTASRRLARLVSSGDLVVEQIGAGKRATRYRIPALDDAVDRGGLAFLSDGSLQPLAIHSGRNANDVEDDQDPLAIHSDPVAIRSRSALGGTEVGSNEVEIRARVREALAVDVSGRVCADVEPVPDDAARARVREDVTGPLRDRLGFRPSKVQP